MLTFMLHLHQLNPPTTSFVCGTRRALHILNYNDNANWNIRVDQHWNFFLINKRFCEDRWGWNRSFTGMDGNRREAEWGRV